MKIWVCLCLLLVGCAHPNYQTPIAPQPTQLQSEDRCNFTAPCAVHFATAGLCGSLAFESAVRTDGNESSAILTLNAPVSPEVQISGEPLLMPAHGHSSARPLFDRIDATHFRLRHLFFFMAGEWEMTLHLINGGARVDEAIVPFCL